MSDPLTDLQQARTKFAAMARDQKPCFNLEHDPGTRAGTLHMYGAIGGWWGDIDAATLVPEIRAMDVDTLDVYINSPGGDVYDAIAIRNALRSHTARVVTYVDGLAASAASFIAAAGDEVVMGANSELMIHDAWTVGIGNAADMREVANALDRISDNIAAMYAAKAGGDPADWRDTMRASTWYSADEAVAAGLADRVATIDADRTDDEDVAAVASLADHRATIAALYPTRAAAMATHPRKDTTMPEPTEAPTVAAPAAAVPVTQRPAGPAATATPRVPAIADIANAIAAVKNGEPFGLSGVSEAVTFLNALSDITISGDGALPVGGDVLQPNWLGQLYQGIPYVRQFITLGNLGTGITAAGKKGYKLHRGTEAAPVRNFDGTWAGNKANIASGVGFTESAVSELFRFAFGVDIAREFYDLPGGAEVVLAFLNLILEDNLVWSDELARWTWVQVAGSPVAAKVYPGVDGHDYGSALGMVIQGILAVKAAKADGRRDVPTFIIANEAAFEELIYTPKDLIPEFVNFTASTDRAGSGDGLQLVVGNTGIQSTASVIVGAGRAVDFDELPGGPLRIDALDLARGGVDKAVHGYLQRFIVRPEAVVHIGTADAWAATTTYVAGDLAKVGAGVLQVTIAGKSGAAAPALPGAVGGTVVDGTVTWVRIS